MDGANYRPAARCGNCAEFYNYYRDTFCDRRQSDVSANGVCDYHAFAYTLIKAQMPANAPAEKE